MTLVYKTKIEKIVNNVDFVSFIESALSNRKSYTLQCPADWDEKYKEYVSESYNDIWNSRGIIIQFNGNLIHVSCL